MHKHNFIIIKQIPLPLLTVHTFYKCECGEEFDEYENPSGKFNGNNQPQTIKETEGPNR